MFRYLYAIYFLCLFGQRYVNSFSFPGPDEDPILAVLNFIGKLRIFSTNGSIIETIGLKGGRFAGSQCMDFNYREEKLYWLDRLQSSVFSLQAGGFLQEQKMIVDNDNMGSPSGLAFDWIHNNLYISDRTFARIVVANPDTGAKKVLFNVSYPVDVEVDPETGWLYYIAGLFNSAHIGKTALDGSNRVVISDNLKRPNSLSLDYKKQRLYWTEDYNVNSIFSISVNGDNHHRVYYGGRRSSYIPSFITVSREYMYWTQKSLLRVYGAKKNNVTDIMRFRNLETITRADARKNDQFMGILAIDPSKQKISPNRCGDNNGGCSHFCLPTLQQTTPFICACPDDLRLSEDNINCS